MLCPYCTPQDPCQRCIDRAAAVLPQHEDRYVGRTIAGEIIAGEFVGVADEEGREPGVYVTIKLKDETTALVGGPVSVTYLPVVRVQRQ